MFISWLGSSLFLFLRYIHGNVWDLCRSFLHPLISALQKLQGEPCHSHVRCMQCNTMDVKLIYMGTWGMGIYNINIFIYNVLMI